MTRTVHPISPTERLVTRTTDQGKRWLTHEFYTARDGWTVIRVEVA